MLLAHNIKGQEYSDVIAATAIHFDTVNLSQSLERHELPSVESLLARDFNYEHKKNKYGYIVTRACYKPLNNSGFPYISVTSNEFGYSGIYVSFSLAKLVGENGLTIQDDCDIERKLNILDSLVFAKTGIKFHAQAANVSRMDVNADFLVGEKLVPYYINSLSQPTARLIPLKIGQTTIQFSNNSRKFQVYGKHKQMTNLAKKGKALESDVIAAKGLLRVEARYFNASLRGLTKRIKTEPSANNLLRMVVAKDIMRETLVLLNLHKLKPCNAKFDEMMLSAFGKNMPKMVGVIYCRERYGEDFWKRIGWSKSTIQRTRDELKKANLWDTLQSKPLPALAIHDV